MKRTSYLAFTLLVALAAVAVALEGCSAWPFGTSKEGLEEAIAEFRQAVQWEPGNAEAYRYLSLAYKLDGRLEDAIATYQKGTEANPEAGWPRVGLGKLYLEEDRVEEAIAEFKQAIELEPNNGEAYGYLSLAYKLDGRLEEAIEVYEEVVKVNPGRAWPYLGLGDLYMNQRDLEKAATEYQRAIALEPYNGETYDRIRLAYDSLSLAYRLDGRPEEAIKVCEEGAKVNPGRAWPYLGLGDLYMDQGNLEKAATEYQRAIALEPYLVYGYERLGKAYEAQGDIEAALVQYLKAADIALGPETGMKPYLEKAEKHIAEGDLQAAESAIETARGVMPYDPHLLSLAVGLDLALMERYKAKGQMSAARVKAWDALLLDPKQELALEMLTYYDFIDNLDRARIDASHEPFEHVKVTSFTMPATGDERQVLFMHPDARVSYQLKAPSEPAVLRFSLAMSPESWDWGGDGATFEIYLDKGSEEELLFSRYISNDAEDRRWHDEEIDLSPYAGQEVELVFVTGPGPGVDFTGDEAGWATPRVMWAWTEE